MTSTAPVTLPPFREVFGKYMNMPLSALAAKPASAAAPLQPSRAAMGSTLLAAPQHNGPAAMEMSVDLMQQHAAASLATLAGLASAPLARHHPAPSAAPRAPLVAAAAPRVAMPAAAAAVPAPPARAKLQHPPEPQGPVLTGSELLRTITPAAEPATSRKPALARSGPGGQELRERTGRWTREEGELFLEGLRLYGKDWKKISRLVKTRTLVQIRTHAQKVFQKLGYTTATALAGPVAKRTLEASSGGAKRRRVTVAA